MEINIFVSRNLTYLHILKDKKILQYLDKNDTCKKDEGKNKGSKLETNFSNSRELKKKNFPRLQILKQKLSH